MALLRNLVIGIFVLLVVLAISVALLIERIDPATIGVKVNKLGGGIVEHDYRTGYHLGIVGVHSWTLLDGRVHFVSFARDGEEYRGSDTNVDATSSLDIRTSDNNTASLDVTVVYRIIPGRGWQLVRDGLTFSYRDRVRQSIQGVLREELSQLSPDDFVRTDVRLARVEAALPALRENIEQFHVEPLSTLVRAVRFPEKYEEQLQLKQLTRQKALLAEAREREEKQEQVTQSIEKETEALEKRLSAEWDKRLQEVRSDNQVRIAQILAESEIYARTTRADADASHTGAIAEGELALATAEALRDQLRNAALDSVGGRILLARQAAENLQIDEVTLNSNDPAVPSVLDLDQLVRLLLGTSGK